jgi:hypothetical protein
LILNHVDDQQKSAPCPRERGETKIAVNSPRVFLDRPLAFLSEDIGSVLKQGAKVCQRNLPTKCSGLFSEPSLARWSPVERTRFKARPYRARPASIADEVIE